MIDAEMAPRGGHGDGLRKRVSIDWALPERGKQVGHRDFSPSFLWTFRSFASHL